MIKLSEPNYHLLRKYFYSKYNALISFDDRAITISADEIAAFQRIFFSGGDN